MTYHPDPLTLGRDVEKTTTLLFECQGNSVCKMFVFLGADRATWALTCTLASNQVLALRLIRVDGRDGDGVLCVGVQVLQDVGGFITIHDGLVTETEREE